MNVQAVRRGPAEPVRQLGLMAKFWEPGRVKTRLGADVGMDAAAALHRLFVGQLLVGLRHAADRRTILGTPAAARVAMLSAAADWRGRWDWQTQGRGDLGDRMRHWFADRLRGGGAAMLLGADCPTLREVEIDLAFVRLRTTDVVLGPAQDGGYYLLGIRAADGDDRWQRLFENIDWSTDQTLLQTLAAARRSGLRVEQLTHRRDVDDLSDLHALLAQLDRSNDAHDRSFVNRIRRIVSP